MTNKHQEQGAVSFIWLKAYWGTQIWESLFWRKKQLKQSRVCPTKKQTQRLPSRRLLRAGTSSTLSLQLGSHPLSLPPTTSRCPRWRTELQDGILESSPGEVCPDGSTMALLHCGDRQGSQTGFHYRSYKLPRMRIRLRSARC